MIHFVVVTGAVGSVSRLRCRLSSALERTRIYDGERVATAAASGAWAAEAIARPDPVCPVRLTGAHDSIVVVNGPALSRSGGQAQLSDHLLSRFRAGGPAALAADLSGTYNVVAIDPAQGMCAFGDCSGLFPLYFHQGEDVAVVSNRSSTIAAALGTDGWQIHALGWVIGRATLFGEDVPVAGVQHLATGHQARAAWGSGRLRLERSPEWIWPAPSGDSGRDDLTSQEWDEIVDDLVTNARLIDKVDGPIRLALTGGKDSRLSLAIAKAAGLTDRIVAFTSGRRSHPEADHAIAVARTAGVRHELATAAQPTPTPAGVATASPAPFDGAGEWARLGRQVHRYEGIVSAWNDRSGWAKPESVTIEGFFGELYRNGHEQLFRPRHEISTSSYVEMFTRYHQRVRRSATLSPDEQAAQDDWFREWVRSTADETRIDALPDRCFVDHRLAHWTGPLLQNAAFVTVNPLVSAFAAHKALELSLEARTLDRFHLEVIRRTAPELVDLPLFDDEWGCRDVARPAARPGTPSPPQPAPSRGRRALRSRFTRSTPAPGARVERAAASNPPPGKGDMHALTRHRPAWRFMEHEGAAIVRLMEEAASDTEMGAVCDMDKVVDLARRAGELRSGPVVRELFACMGAGIALLGRAAPVAETCTPARTTWDDAADDERR